MAETTLVELSARRISDIPPTGITELYVPSSPIVDICFVHGFTGHPERTWRSRKRAKNLEVPNKKSTKRAKLGRFLSNSSPGTDAIAHNDTVSDIPEFAYWPRGIITSKTNHRVNSDLLPDVIPHARLLTFGYDTNIRHSLEGPISQNRLSDHAGDFLFALEDCRQQNPCRPLIFIAHSLGGLLVKDTLRISKYYEHSEPDRSNIYESTTNIFFFGTPHVGADPRNTLHRTLTNLTKALGFQVNKEIVQTLMPGVERTKLLAEDILKWTSECGWTVYTFQEECAHSALGVKIVEDSSSSINDPRHKRIVHIRADHVDMCRFSSADDPEFHKVSSALLRAQEQLIYLRSSSHSDAEQSQEHASPQTAILQLSSEQVDNILEKLSFDGIDARYMTLKNAQRKTCQWLPKHPIYKSWLDPSQMDAHHGFLWIKGKPGTGKSVCMKYLYQSIMRTKKNHVVIKFFFNARGATLEHSTEGMYRSLLSQLINASPAINIDSDALSQLLSLEGKESWPIEALKEAFSSILAQIERQELYCLVDALDECSEDESPRRSLQLVLEDEDDHSSDIRQYIHSQLRIDQNRIRQEIENESFERSSKIFLWAALVVDILNKENDKGGDVSVRKRLRQIPKGLHDLFHDILTRNNDNVEELILCIQWILFAKQPLRSEELYFAMQLRNYSDTTLVWDQAIVPMDRIHRFNLNVSKGLAEVAKKTSTVQFIHESVRDYLLREKGLETLLRYRKPPTSLSEGVSHDNLRDICLKQINGAPSALDPTENGSDRTNMPFLHYAVSYILAHANSAQSSGSDQTDFLSKFPREAWVSLDNELQKHKTRRHSNEVELLYVLAEKNMASLIQIHPEQSILFDSFSNRERFLSPLIAAMASGNNEAIFALALAGAKESLAPDRRRDLDQIEKELRDMPHFRSNLDGTHWKRMDKLSLVCSLGSVTLQDALWDQMLTAVNLEPEDSLGGLQCSISAGVAEYMIEKGAHVDAYNRQLGNTALMRAVKAGALATAEYLLLKGANPNIAPKRVQSMNGSYYLDFAESGSMIALLIQHRALLGLHVHRLLSKKNIDSFISASIELPYERRQMFFKPSGALVLAILDTLGGDENARALSLLHMVLNMDNPLGGLLLRTAARGGRVRAMKMLCGVGRANVDTQDHEGCTALYDAVQYAIHPRTYSILPGTCEFMKVRHAIFRNRLATVQCLLDAGANPNLRANNGVRPLEMFYFSALSIDVNFRNTSGFTPLTDAIIVRDFETLELLIRHHSINVNLLNRYDFTPLSTAVNCGNLEAFEILIRHHSIDVNLQGLDGRTSLIHAATKPHKITMFKQLLYHRSSNANIQDTNGRTALSWAAETSHLGALELLLKTDSVDVNLPDNVGRSPLLWAAQFGCFLTVQILISNYNVDRTVNWSLGRSTSGFHEAFSRRVADLEEASEEVFKKCMEGSSPLFNEGWRGWPKDADQADVLSWFTDLSKKLAVFAENYNPTLTHQRRPLAQPKKSIQGSTAERKLDVGFVSDPEAGKDSRCH
ncbi:ankyrin [Xylariaceae sp. AK1471]|nr:ankyrin [Xylariaceae sp. AK1471]